MHTYSDYIKFLPHITNPNNISPFSPNLIYKSYILKSKESYMHIFNIDYIFSCKIFIEQQIILLYKFKIDVFSSRHAVV